MKNLDLNELEKIQGGSNIAWFTCGLGVFAISASWAYGGIFVFGEMTAVACAAAIADM
jgi:hypothetical protein